MSFFLFAVDGAMGIDNGELDKVSQPSPCRRARLSNMRGTPAPWQLRRRLLSNNVGGGDG